MTKKEQINNLIEHIVDNKELIKQNLLQVMDFIVLESQDYKLTIELKVKEKKYESTFKEK